MFNHQYTFVLFFEHQENTYALTSNLSKICIYDMSTGICCFSTNGSSEFVTSARQVGDVLLVHFGLWACSVGGIFRIINIENTLQGKEKRPVRGGKQVPWWSSYDAIWEDEEEYPRNEKEEMALLHKCKPQ